jgi:hypothetical protein
VVGIYDQDRSGRSGPPSGVGNRFAPERAASVGGDDRRPERRGGRTAECVLLATGTPGGSATSPAACDRAAMAIARRPQMRPALMVLIWVAHDQVSVIPRPCQRHSPWQAAEKPARSVGEGDERRLEHLGRALPHPRLSAQVLRGVLDPSARNVGLTAELAQARNDPPPRRPVVRSRQSAKGTGQRYRVLAVAERTLRRAALLSIGRSTRLPFARQSAGGRCASAPPRARTCQCAGSRGAHRSPRSSRLTSKLPRHGSLAPALVTRRTSNLCGSAVREGITGGAAGPILARRTAGYLRAGPRALRRVRWSRPTIRLPRSRP